MVSMRSQRQTTTTDFNKGLAERTWVLSRGAVQTCRSEIPLVVTTEMGLGGKDHVVIWCSAVLLPYQGSSWIKELGIRDCLRKYEAVRLEKEHLKTFPFSLTHTQSHALPYKHTLTYKHTLSYTHTLSHTHTLPYAANSSPSRVGSKSGGTKEDSLCRCASTFGSLEKKRFKSSC